MNSRDCIRARALHREGVDTAILSLCMVLDIVRYINKHHRSFQPTHGYPVGDCTTSCYPPSETQTTSLMSSHSKANPSRPMATGTSVPIANEPGTSMAGAALPVGVDELPDPVPVPVGEVEPVPDEELSPPDEPPTMAVSAGSETNAAVMLLFLQSDPGLPSPETKLTGAHCGKRG
jgi:hypothetical protein